MNPNLSAETEINLALRLTVGLVLGAIIGFERELHRQPAGFRTHSLVSLGAALFTVVSAFGFAGATVDPTRIAAQIVSGIGFIGAGTILQYRGHIRGLTTAASLWSVAAIGTAAGAGLFVVATTGTILILVILSLLDQVEEITRRRFRVPPSPYRPPPEEPDEGSSEDLP
ncbi:MAG: MgtC/SapB family protein [Chloroflexota bacterium]|nr:MgtC/SapB family protein [Chloroflexota bacterium]